MAFNRAFGQSRPSSTGYTAEKHRSWDSLITDMESRCAGMETWDDDSKEGSGSNSNDVNQMGGGEVAAAARGGDGADAKQGLQGCSANNDNATRKLADGEAFLKSLYMHRLSGNRFRETTTSSSSSAGDKSSKKPAAPMPPSMSLEEWISHHKENGQDRPRIMGGLYHCSIDKSYLEDAARLALSMAEKLQPLANLSSSTALEKLTVANVFVSDTKSGQIDFVNYLGAANPGDEISYSVDATAMAQRRAIYALGKVYYEIFSRGLKPPASMGRESTFGLALIISNNLGHGDDMDDNNEEIRKKQRRRGGGSVDPYGTLEVTGVPPSLCRLVSHMLKNDDASGGLFYPDEAVAHLSDVVDDLRRMVDDPRSYLHDALIMRLEPILPDKLYGRTKELQRFHDIADAVPFGRFTQAVTISGFPGCGKSFLVKEVENHLKEKDWECLHCKFDQGAQSQPLLAITSAFDDLLVHFVSNLTNSQQQEVRDRIAQLLERDEVDALCQLVPTLTQLMTIEDVCQPESNSREKTVDLSDGTASTATISVATSLLSVPPVGQSSAPPSKICLHRLFGLLVKVLSRPERPLIICFDDLQWADAATLDLINSLLEGIVTDDELPPCIKHEGQCALFAVCYRSGETKSSGPLSNCIKKMQDCETVSLTEIQLEGISRNAVNALVSEALFYPRRLTRSLATLIHQKTAGNPLFVKEFLNSLADENLLKYSLSSHEWRWDNDVIEMKAVANGVVELLTCRLKRLPGGALTALQILACFGHDVSLDMMVAVGDVCGGKSDIVASLEYARKELLVKKTNERLQTVYSFAHDMVQNTVYEGIGGKDRIRMLKDIAEALIAKTSDNRSDADLFIIVGLINRVCPDSIKDAADRARYAKLNLLAGEKCIQTPGWYESALRFLEKGISFLDDHWEHDYKLSMALYKTAASVAQAFGKSHDMNNYLNQVFDHASCYDDKLDSMSVKVISLINNDGKTQEALNTALDVLAYLGEPFPNNLDKAAIHSELLATYDCMRQISPTRWENMPAMTDPLKLKAMGFLSQCFMCFFCKKSIFNAVIACRMVRLTLSHGQSQFSSLAISAMGSAITTILRQYDLGYHLSKIALSMSSHHPKLCPLVILLNQHAVAFKEPIQAMLPLMIENYKTALKYGDTYTAYYLAMNSVIKGFHSGYKPLASLIKELGSYFRQLPRYNIIRVYYGLLPIANAITNLSGERFHHVWDAVEGYKDDDENLSKAFTAEDFALTDHIATVKIKDSFIFRKLDKAAEVVKQHQDFFFLQSQSGVQAKFIFIYRMFYTGLVAFHQFRETKDDYWMKLGKNAIQEMEIWERACKWNVENKTLLLKAEYHFSVGDFDASADEYNRSISSARDHQFIGEEAIANELAAYFHMAGGRTVLWARFLNQAKVCYDSWGAVKKAETLKPRVGGVEDGLCPPAGTLLQY